ncbi:hypothetical protein HUV60_007120 [Streptomyces sp. KMM 9044]|nr:hypothetical protein [Streptomyces sp. KMM 9044]WAX77464.1 hypothetical protein HUV60_007120 [Streptomyces sp. KMM 9044]
MPSNPEERDSCLVADVTAPGPELAAALGRADLVLLAVHQYCNDTS